jgi:hypothetical protein
MNSGLLIPAIVVFSGIGIMVCFKLYNDKVKSIIISHDQIQIDFKLLKSRVDTLLNQGQTNEPRHDDEDPLLGV